MKSQLTTTKEELQAVKEEIRFTKTLVFGTTGQEVKRLQEVLKSIPDVYPEGRVTGYFGPLTQSAVRRFQEKHGIESVGIVGPRTIAKLNELAAPTEPAIPVVPVTPATPAIPAVPTEQKAIPAVPATPPLFSLPEPTQPLPLSPPLPSPPTQTVSPSDTPIISPPPPPLVTITGSDGTWCYDSDLPDYFKKGYCQDNISTKNDYCKDSKTVYDWFCHGEVWKGSGWESVSCSGSPIGYSDGICSDGDFSTPSASTANIVCTDSDGGLDYYTKGTATYSGVGMIEYEVCSGGAYLGERRCSQSDHRYNSVSYLCPNGCSDGACIKKTAYSPSTDSKINNLVASIINSLRLILQEIQKLVK